jgi:hypothetical protein
VIFQVEKRYHPAAIDDGGDPDFRVLPLALGNSAAGRAGTPS